MAPSPVPAPLSPSVVPAAESRVYHPELDTLRFVAFLMVFVHHVLPQNPAAYEGYPPFLAQLLGAFARACALGVTLFFSLSAFLITDLLRRERQQTGSVAIGRFYLRRTLRIWPLYFAFLLLAQFVLPRITVLPPLGQFAAPYFLFVGNWACVMWSYPPGCVALLWSVSIEEQFYLTWAPLFRMLDVRRAAFFALALFPTAMVARLVVVFLRLPHPAMWCSTFTHLDTFGAGILAALLLRGRVPRLSAAARAALFVGGLSLWTVAFFFIPLNGAPTLEQASRLLPAATVGSAAMLIGTLGATSSLVRWGPLVYLGRISYGLYVFHPLALMYTEGLLDGWPRVSKNFFGLGLTIAAASVSYAVLEKPFLRLKLRYTVVESRPGG
jgi:peptidoglycan/LPS O-acetylase OafA/YrhL